MKIHDTRFAGWTILFMILMATVYCIHTVPDYEYEHHNIYACDYYPWDEALDIGELGITSVFICLGFFIRFGVLDSPVQKLSKHDFKNNNKDAELYQKCKLYRITWNDMVQKETERKERQAYLQKMDECNRLVNSRLK